MTRDELRAVLPGGVNHDAAMKWIADDKTALQCCDLPKDNWCDWQPLNTNVDVFCADRKWRIKPKTLRYRVAVMRRDDGEVFLQTAYSESEEQNFAEHCRFIEWKTNTQEVEE